MFILWLQECTTAGHIATPQLGPRKVPEIFLVLCVFIFYFYYSNLSFDWLVPRLIRFWTTASYCRIMAPIPPDIYMGWTFQFGLFKPWGNFSSVCRDEIFAYNHNSVFILLSLSVGTEILSSRFNDLKFHHGLKLSTINPPLRGRFLQK